jgi:hypothetical protein
MLQTITLAWPFALSLIPKMVLIALVVVASTSIAEKAGPVVGGLIATLPISSGPVYFLLALDHGPDFISGAALTSFNGMVAAGLMLIVYVIVAQTAKTAVSVGIGFVAWALALAGLLISDSYPVVSVAIACAVLGGGSLLVRHYGDVLASSSRSGWQDFLVRAVAVALLVAAVEIAAAFGGPETTGIFASVPVTFLAMMVIIQSQHGGPASAAVMAHALPGLVGVTAAFLLLHFSAVPLGDTAALLLALATSVGWSAFLLTLHLSRLHAGTTAQAKT